MSYTSDRLILKSVYVCIISVCVPTKPPITSAHNDSTESHMTGGFSPSPCHLLPWHPALNHWGHLNRQTLIYRVNHYEMEEISDYHWHWFDLMEPHSKLLIFSLSHCIFFKMRKPNKNINLCSACHVLCQVCGLLMTYKSNSPPPCCFSSWGQDLLLEVSVETQ